MVCHNSVEEKKWFVKINFFFTIKFKPIFFWINVFHEFCEYSLSVQQQKMSEIMCEEKFVLRKSVGEKKVVGEKRRWWEKFVGEKISVIKFGADK